MSHHYIKTKFGNIEFDLEDMPGCCGVSVIVDLYFRHVTDNEKLYKYFHNIVIFGAKDIETGGSWDDNIDRSDDWWKVNKFLLTDKLRPKDKASVYNLCHFIGAQYGTVTYNPNSGNKVQVFELTRPKAKYKLCNGTYVSQTGGIQTP
jgi:hypothetical protein